MYELILSKIFADSHICHNELINMLTTLNSLLNVKWSKRDSFLFSDWRHVANFTHSIFYSIEANQINYVPNYYGMDNIPSQIGKVIQKVKCWFSAGASWEIWEEYSQMLDPNSQISQKGICMLGVLLPTEKYSPVTADEIFLWLWPMMALWESRPTSGLVMWVMMYLLGQVAKN